MLLPALYNLAVDHLLPHGFAVVGFARQEQAHDDFRTDMRKAVNTFSRFAPYRTRFGTVLPRDCSSSRPILATSGATRSWRNSCKRSMRSEARRKPNFYLAVPPTAVATIIANLGQVGLVTPTRRASTGRGS
jgi:glucose-6-phosphate 1-dehydrogenase